MTVLAWIGAAAVCVGVMAWLCGVVVLWLLARAHGVLDADDPFLERVQVVAVIVLWPFPAMWWLFANLTEVLRQRAFFWRFW